MSTMRRVLAMNASDVLPLLAGAIGRVCRAGLCNRTVRIILITLVLSGAAWKGYQRALPVERLDIRGGGVAVSMEEHEIDEQAGRALETLLGRLDAEAEIARLGDGNVVLDGMTYYRVYSSKLNAKEWTRLTALSKAEGTDDYIFQAGDHLSRMSVADVRRLIARRETQAREMERFNRSAGSHSIRFYVTPEHAKKMDAEARQRFKDYDEGVRSVAEQARQRELGRAAGLHDYNIVVKKVRGEWQWRERQLDEPPDLRPPYSYSNLPCPPSTKRVIPNEPPGN